MALFAGALLRTIECVMATTGAHVPVAKEGVGAGGQPRGAGWESGTGHGSRWDPTGLQGLGWHRWAPGEWCRVLPLNPGAGNRAGPHSLPPTAPPGEGNWQG